MDYKQNEWLYGILCEYGFDEAVNAFKKNVATLGFEKKLTDSVDIEVAKLGNTTVNREEYVRGRLAVCERIMRDMRDWANDGMRCDRYNVGSIIWNYVCAEAIKAALLEQATNCKPKIKAKPMPTFASIIQHPNKEQVLKRLHDLIDGRSGADVGSVLLKARIDGYLTRNPTKAEFTSEFELIGTWSGIANYMNDNSAKALDRANKILIII